MIKINGSIIKDIDLHAFTETNPLFVCDGLMYIALISEAKEKNLKLIVFADIDDKRVVTRWFLCSNKDNINKYINSNQSLLTTIENEDEIIFFDIDENYSVIKNTTMTVNKDNFPIEYRPEKDSYLKELLQLKQ